MAYKEKKDNSAYRLFRADLKAGTPGRLYVFHGEEAYLKNHYMEQLKKALCGAFEDFNYTFLEGERLSLDDLTDALYTLPMGSERKLVVVRDYKLMQPAGDLKEALPELFAQLPEFVCLVFFFDALEFKADKRLNIYKALAANGSIVEFEQAPSADLIPWLKRRFYAQGKQIDTAACDHLLFLCGGSMTNLITEVDKIAAGTAGPVINRADIDALASRVLEADIFTLTDCIQSGDYRKGLHMLRDLLDARHEPVAIQAALTKQLQRLYGARLALEAKKGEGYVMELCGFRSSYPARLLLNAARKTSLKFLRGAQHRCLVCDVHLKSNISDDRRTLELLLLQLAQEARA